MKPVSYKRNLELRADVLAAARRFFREEGYLEIETPIRIPAPAPETHIDAEPCGTWYLQTSPELCMKRLLADGFERIFQICKCFRRKERGARHLPELTMLEWYTAGEDYGHMMAQCERLLAAVLDHLGRPPAIDYQGRHIDLGPAWQRLSVAEAFDRYGSLSMQRALETGRFDEIVGIEIEPQLGLDRPVFLFDYPLACGALARRKPDSRPGGPDLVERFELYIGGLELCNAFSELCDPEEQRQRFEQEQACRRAAGKPVYPTPEPFLQALPRMPEATGNALGIDRLVMLLTDSAGIDDVVAFTPEDL